MEDTPLVKTVSKDGYSTLTLSELKELKQFEKTISYRILVGILEDIIREGAMRLSDMPIISADGIMFSAGELSGKRKDLRLVLNLSRKAEQELEKRKKKETPKKTAINYYPE